MKSIIEILSESKSAGKWYDVPNGASIVHIDLSSGQCEYFDDLNDLGQALEAVDVENDKIQQVKKALSKPLTSTTLDGGDYIYFRFQ